MEYEFYEEESKLKEVKMKKKCGTPNHEQS